MLATGVGNGTTGGPVALPRPATPTLAGWTTKALGTFCSVLVTRPKALEAAQRILSDELTAIDRACSRFRGDSELSALNRADGQRITVSVLLATAIEIALRAALITDGDVDPTCGHSLVRLGYDRDFDELAADTSGLTKPPAPAAGWRCVEFDADERTVRVPSGVLLDLGATAKALAADRAADAVFERLGCGVLVNLGGDIAVAGQAPDGGWRVGVDDGAVSVGADLHTAGGSGGSSPRIGAPGRGETVVAIDDGGVATSGPAFRSWRRGDQGLHHIVVPANGQPAEIYWAAVSVAAATCVDANIASTAEADPPWPGWPA